MPEIAPETYKLVPESIWKNVTVNGKIYGVFNYQQWGYTARKGFAVNSNIADEFNFDWKSLKGTDPITVMNAFTGLFEQAIAKYPDMIGFETSGGSKLFTGQPLLWDMESVGDINTPGWVRIEELETIINQFATEEFKQFCDIMHDWSVFIC